METTWSPNEGRNVTSNSTADTIENEQESPTLYIFVTIFNTLTVLLIFLLNPLMLFTLRRVTSVQTTTKIFMASLTLSDLLNGAFWILRIVEITAGSWLLGDFLCAASDVCTILFDGLSILSLLLLTMDRYIAISRPLRYLSMMSVFRSKLIVCSTWAVSILFCILIYGIHAYSIIVQNGLSRVCLGGKYDWRVFLTITVIIISLATIFILYAHITIIARNQARRIAAENQAGNGQGGQRINTRSTTTIIIITGTLIITWIPSVIRLAIVSQNQWGTSNKYLAFMLTQALVLSNGWMNVIIYYLRNKDLRMALRSLLSNWHHTLVQRFLP
ncbi:beta-1 adrenergic receptor-like [Patiria miniata]|uniref:G-protein coupled receptors family 1 profile domain-containing protein n=1 Tax=Patiria miniata TaxID=46514 RepID=A0A914A0M3_PATMI|nr:beta-1 adrenergic receptor-like [Patiria miniata]